jgi:hypothetical protein
VRATRPFAQHAPLIGITKGENVTSDRRSSREPVSHNTIDPRSRSHCDPCPRNGLKVRDEGVETARSVITRRQVSPWFDQADSQGLACRVVWWNSGRPGRDVVAEGVGSLPGTSAMAVAQQCGGRQRHGSDETFGTRDHAASRWDVRKSTGCAVRAATRNSSLPQAGMKTVTAKSHGARAPGSPWGCSPPSSLPLCGSVMTH